MPYRAGPGSGMFGSYAYPDTRPRIDVGGALDAFTTGASSLIHAAYQRKLLDAQVARENQNLDLQRQRVALDQQRETREQANADREFGLKQTAERHRFIEAGGIPASEDVDTSPNTLDISSGFKPNLPTGLQTFAGPNDGMTPIQRAMNAGVPRSVSPAAMADQRAVNASVPESVSPDAGSPSTTQPAPVPNRLRLTAESYDPTKGAAYERAISLQELRNEGYMTRAEFTAGANADRDASKAKTAQSLEDLKAQHQKELASINNAARAARTGAAGGSRAMTAGQLEKLRENMAAGIIDRTGGSYDAATEFLNSPDGKWYRDQGVTPAHLSFAHSQYVQGTTNRLLRLQTGLTALTPREAKAAYDSTRALVGAPATPPPATNGSPPQTAPNTAPASRPAPAAATPVNPPSNATPRTLVKPGAPSPKRDTSSSGDDITDQELIEAYNAGKRTNADLRAYVMAQRAKRKAGTM